MYKYKRKDFVISNTFHQIQLENWHHHLEKENLLKLLNETLQLSKQKERIQNAHDELVCRIRELIKQEYLKKDQELEKSLKNDAYKYLEYSEIKQLETWTGKTIDSLIFNTDTDDWTTKKLLTDKILTLRLNNIF